jgi:cytochrome c-type biogenesis protein CcmH
MRRWLLLMLGLLSALPALAVNPDERLADPALEARARNLSRELRCLVCQSESIDDSNAPLAHDLRVLVRDRIAHGDTDDEVLAFLRARYGDYVLLNPPVERATWFLWFGPGMILAIAALGVGLAAARRKPPPPPPLSEQERALVASLLQQDRT